MEEETLKQFTKALADAIRAQDGTTEPINPQDFAARILALSNGEPITGEVRIFWDDTKPASKFGGTWSETEFPAGTFLEAAGSGGSAGTSKTAGLPNIKGEFEVRRSAGNESMAFANNKLFGYNETVLGQADTTSWVSTYGNEWKRSIITFDASKSNGIYKDGVATVQPKSRTVHIWRKVS